MYSKTQILNFIDEGTTVRPAVHEKLTLTVAIGVAMFWSLLTFFRQY